MKNFRKFAYGALIIGGLMLLGAFALWNSTRKFVASALPSQGVVTELLEVRDKDDSSPSYKPVVKFTDRTGAEVTFTSSTSSRPPAYAVGEYVAVLYSPVNSQDAKIKGFASLWLGVLILGILGAAFSAIGASIMYAGRVSVQRMKYLMAYGNAIQTDVQGIDRNTDISVNGKHPWRITSQWVNPASGNVRVFNSEDLWFDPAQFVTGKQVTVLLDPKDPQRYYMDVSFLPEMEEGK